MYHAGAYKDMNREAIAEEVKKEGFDPIYIDDPPGRLYPQHSHPETKLLVFLRGAMEIKVKGEKYHCSHGDKLIISGNTEHSAKVGPEGCAFFWSEKL